MAGLVREGLVDETGKLVEPYFHKGFPLASTLDYQRITLSQQDIREIQMAKSAIRAGIESLIERSGISRQRVHQVFLAGGFGYYLDPQKAAVIGLLPADLADGCRQHVPERGHRPFDGRRDFGRVTGHRRRGRGNRPRQRRSLSTLIH